VFATSHIFQVIFPGALAVSSGLLSVRGIMEDIQKLLGAFSGLVEQGNILRITEQVASTIIMPLFPPAPG